MAAPAKENSKKRGREYISNEAGKEVEEEVEQKVKRMHLNERRPDHDEEVEVNAIEKVEPVPAPEPEPEASQ